MRALTRRLPLLCALLLLAASSPPPQWALTRARPEDVGMSSAGLRRLTDALDGYVKDGRLAGGVALVARRGRVAYVHAFGQRDREASAPMTGDAIFRVASHTKALVSVAALMLQEEGRLRIDDPVARYLPRFERTKVAVPREGGYDVVDATRPITLRDLLTHTAGLGYGWGPARDRWQEAGLQGWYFAGRDEPMAAAVGRMAALPFDAQPGERFVYGYSTDVLGVVVERVSAQSLDGFLRARFLEPLGMRDTHFYLPPEKAARLAAVYSAREDGRIERAPTQGAYVTGPRKSFSGGAGLLSTAGDYARFLQMMLQGGELDGVRILSPGSVELMTRDHLGAHRYEPGVGFGLGFSVVKNLRLRGKPGSVGEFGWGGAYHSVYWVDPREQLVVVYLAQLIPARNLDDHDRLRALVYQALVDGGFRKP